MYDQPDQALSTDRYDPDPISEVEVAETEELLSYLGYIE